jgi:PKHD-type hydroxylase
MILDNYYWYFKDALSHKFCDEVINYAKTFYEPKIAVTGGMKDTNLDNKKLRKLKKVRDATVIWLDSNWIYNMIVPFILKANKEAGWNYQVDTPEQVQFTEYGHNQHYGWHVDGFKKPYDNEKDKKMFGKVRKLSVTCSLSDPNNYKGGELQFNFNDRSRKTKDNIRTCTEILSKGSLVVFPSFVWHRVTPVTEGTRHSLVNWCVGNPYK